DVLIVLSNNPPVNALGAAVRQGLVAAIEQAEADDTVKAVVIACEGQTFFAGADITEFGKPPVMPWLPQVVDRIEACTKPVVAAIHGTAPAIGDAEEGRDVRPLPKSSERQDKLNECDPSVFDEFRQANAKRFRGFEAPLKNIEAVKVACEKPYGEGVIEERKLFMELMS